MKNEGQRLIVVLEKYCKHTAKFLKHKSLEKMKSETVDVKFVCVL